MILSPAEEEALEPFSQEELDLLWCMRYDLGFREKSMLEKFKAF
jgi:hypothetical protein